MTLRIGLPKKSKGGEDRNGSEERCGDWLPEAEASVAEKLRKKGLAVELGGGSILIKAELMNDIIDAVRDSAASILKEGAEGGDLDCTTIMLYALTVSAVPGVLRTLSELERAGGLGGVAAAVFSATMSQTLEAIKDGLLVSLLEAAGSVAGRHGIELTDEEKAALANMVLKAAVKDTEHIGLRLYKAFAEGVIAAAEACGSGKRGGGEWRRAGSGLTM